jgi:hypothetical protein
MSAGQAETLNPLTACSRTSENEMQVTRSDPQNHADQTMTSTGGSCGGRALCGWSPPPLPADSSLKQRVDRLVLGNVAAISILVVVVALLNLSPHLPRRADLAVDGAAALIGGGWCTLNFWRCRHAHCLITGPGWLALSIFAFGEAGLGRSVIGGYEQPALVAVLGFALAFEAFWQLRRHTNAVAGR